MYLLVTVDAEAVHGNSPLEEFMWGRLKGFTGEYGIGLIADICEHYGVAATFFLDVYEHAYYGLDALKTVATYLNQRGHDVQLHTHPAWYQDRRDNRRIRQMKKEHSCFPSGKYWMNLNTLEEQITILQHGQNLLENWLGKPVIAHRAGSYALDLNTIHALCEVGIPVDSSMFYSHPHNKVTWSKNILVEQAGVLEVPVTVLRAKTMWDWGVYRQNKVGSRYPTYIPTDINWCPRLEDLQEFVIEGKRHNLPIINLFLHSYSLIKFDHYFTKLAPNEKVIKKLAAFLEFCAADKEVKAVSVAELWRLFQAKQVPVGADDFVPEVADWRINVYEKVLERLQAEVYRFPRLLTRDF